MSVLKQVILLLRFQTHPMKLHRTLVYAVIETLQKIFNDGVYADKAVEQVLKQNTRWGSRDRRFIAETIYEMVRWWRLIKQSADIQEPLTEIDRSEEHTSELQ